MSATKYLWFIGGLVFTVLWASASTATKIALSCAQPLVISEVRFAMASFLLLTISHIILGNRLPKGTEWKQIAIYGFFNIAIYLGAYVIAMKRVTAGIGVLAVSINPVLISLMSVFFLRKKLSLLVVYSLVICSVGVLCAAWPLFATADVSVFGLLILLLGMLSYSLAAIYFSSRNWGDLDLLTINGWQTLIGGLLLLPFAFFSYQNVLNHFSQTFWLAVTWLAIPVSVFAIQLWLWLLKTNAVRASLWLFLCPLFGFVIATWLAHESISIFTISGLLMVMGGLMLSRIKLRKDGVISY